MKKNLLSILAIFTLVLYTSFDYSQTEAMEILKVNCPDSYEVVRLMGTIPENYGTSISRREGITHWLSKGSPIEYLASFSTGVHECFHGYNSTGGKYHMDKENKTRDKENDYFCYYINKEEKYIVNRTDVFPSSEMVKQFTLSTKMDRFSTYIYPSAPDQSTQVDGVYALLDEWNAYYLGTKTLLELIPYIKKTVEPSSENYKSYFFNLNSDYIAYIEFKVYILNYLLYAKTNYPDNYQKIIANKDFVNAFYAIDKAYSKQVDKYFSEKKLLIEYMNKNSMNVTEDETGIFFGDEGLSNYTFKHKKMVLELAKEKYAGVFADLR